MAGLLDIFDPSVAQEFSLDPEERKRLMLGNWLMGISSGLLGSRKGQELQGLGFGSLAGMGAAQQAVRDAGTDKYQRFKMMSEGQKIVDQRKAAEQAARDQQELQGIFAGGGQPDLAPLANGQGPTVANAAAQVPGSPKGDAYRKAAAWYAARGNTEGAKRMMDMANSFDEEFAQTPQVGRNSEGKTVNALIGKKGTVKVLNDFAPIPKFREVNDGKTTRIMNEYMLPDTGANIAMQTTPGQDLQHSEWQADYGLRRNADQRAAASAGQGPAAPAGYRWKSDGTLEYIPGGPQDPANQKPDKPSDQQLATGSFLGRMRGASQVINKLEVDGYTPGLGQTGINALEGVPLVGGAGGYLARSARNSMTDVPAQYEAAQNAWLMAKLRKDSGANLPPGELETERKIYFPQPNDPPEVRKQKGLMRQQVEQGMEQQAGSGAPKAPPQKDLVKNTTALVKAREAIKAGKDPEAVKARLREAGYSDEGL